MQSRGKSIIRLTSYVSIFRHCTRADTQNAIPDSEEERNSKRLDVFRAQFGQLKAYYINQLLHGEISDHQQVEFAKKDLFIKIDNVYNKLVFNPSIPCASDNEKITWQRNIASEFGYLQSNLIRIIEKQDIITGFVSTCQFEMDNLKNKRREFKTIDSIINCYNSIVYQFAFYYLATLLNNNIDDSADKTAFNAADNEIDFILTQIYLDYSQHLNILYNALLKGNRVEKKISANEQWPTEKEISLDNRELKRIYCMQFAFSLVLAHIKSEYTDYLSKLDSRRQDRLSANKPSDSFALVTQLHAAIQKRLDVAQDQQFFKELYDSYTISMASSSDLENNILQRQQMAVSEVVVEKELEDDKAQNSLIVRLAIDDDIKKIDVKLRLATLKKLCIQGFLCMLKVIPEHEQERSGAWCQAVINDPKVVELHKLITPEFEALINRCGSNEYRKNDSYNDLIENISSQAVEWINQWLRFKNEGRIVSFNVSDDAADQGALVEYHDDLQRIPFIHNLILQYQSNQSAFAEIIGQFQQVLNHWDDIINHLISSYVVSKECYEEIKQVIGRIATSVRSIEESEQMTAEYKKLNAELTEELNLRIIESVEELKCDEYEYEDVPISSYSP